MSAAPDEEALTQLFPNAFHRLPALAAPYFAMRLERMRRLEGVLGVDVPTPLGLVSLIHVEPAEVERYIRSTSLELVPLTSELRWLKERRFFLRGPHLVLDPPDHPPIAHMYLTDTEVLNDLKELQP